MGFDEQQKFLQEIVDRVIIETEKVRLLLIVPVTENAKLDCDHNKLLIGPPGIGTTLLARALDRMW